MDDELYGVAGCDSHVVASLRCPSQSEAMAVWSSSKKSYDICTSAGGSVTVPAHDTYHLAGAGLSNEGGLHYPLAACSGANASAVATRELSLTLCSNSIASSNSTLNTTELRLEEAKSLAEKLCDGPLSSAANLWILRASMEINSLATASGSSPLNKENLSSLFDLFGTWSCLFSRLSPESHPIAECIEVKTGKKNRHRLLALPRPSLKLMQYCIELEVSLASLGNHGALTNARRLYDSVVDMYPQEREVWRSYYSLELKMGTSESVNAVYARARKVLGDSTVHAYPRA
ncbi:hypothetical protein Zm00014a_022073 [Zea mays]|uniref:Uncharacterized protein n=1 Tax=Zea mays TaxID=4577 RepID=A0A3L6FJF9_MAIZE|nr:hypothetical protein Zm00014a_022073 [Zea mays]